MDNSKINAVQKFLTNLRTQRAWGLTRTHGSMFFLEIGEPLPRPGEKKVHGEWHFLIEMCHWRIDTGDLPLVGSDDEQEFIDASFLNLELGAVQSIDAPSPSHDLQVVFTAGLRLSTFTTSAVAKDQWIQWRLYSPDDSVWVANASGDLSQTNAYV